MKTPVGLVTASLTGAILLAASFLIMSIVGGAISPPLMGWLADRYGSMSVCFVLPLAGFVAPAVYGLLYPRLLEKSACAA